MDRFPAQGQLNNMAHSKLRFALATSNDDVMIRRLLRENPTVGSISLSYEREPNYFLTFNTGGSQDRTILAFENERLVCMGRCSTRNRFVNGRIRRVGYLGELRLDKSAQGRFDIVRRGYQFFRQMEEPSPAEFYFTSIAADNERSIRLLERGLPGMPNYNFLTELSTLMIQVPGKKKYIALQARVASDLVARRVKLIQGAADSTENIVKILNAAGSQQQLSSKFTAQDLEDLATKGLSTADFNLWFVDDYLIGCMALWDQRSFKQFVIRGYDRKLSIIKPLLNLTAKFLKVPQLPAVGTILAQAFLSPFALEKKYDFLLPIMIANALVQAKERGIDYITIAFETNDDRTRLTREAFRCREYRTRLYQVSWPGIAPEPCDQRPFFPDLAFL